MATAVHVEEGQSTPVSGAFSWPLGGDGAAVAMLGGCGTRGAFEIENGKVVNCCLYFGRRWLYVKDTELPAGESFSGFIVAKVDHHTQNDPSLSVEAHSGSLGGGPGNNTESVTYRALYHMTNGIIDADLRLCPYIPAYLS